MSGLPMSEDELLEGVTDALTAYGWRWTHHRRSDKALTMGHRGEPDIRAARNGRVLWVELKSSRGVLSPDQLAWMAEFPHPSYQFTAMVVGSDGYDAFLATIR